MTISQFFQLAAVASTCLTVIWSVVKITRAVITLIDFCSRMVREHDLMWKDYEVRHEINERADASAI